MTCDGPTMARPAALEAHVWRIALQGDAAPHVASLSPDEKARWEVLRSERRDRFAICHGAMRQVLGSYLGCTSADVPLTARSGQPPRVVGLELSLAHCDDLALFAVALTPIGVDVEAIDHVAVDELSELAGSTLAPAELNRLLATPSADRARSWLRSWVRKEAVLKARGEGLGDRALRELDVSADRLDELVLVDLELESSYVAAVAITPPAATVTLKEWIHFRR